LSLSLSSFCLHSVKLLSCVHIMDKWLKTGSLTTKDPEAGPSTSEVATVSLNERTEKSKHKSKRRNYCSEYLAPSFTCTGTENEPLPLCVVCSEVLANDCCFYAIQLDESTDIANLFNLLVFVRYEHNHEIFEDILFCKPLPTKTTAEVIFDILNAYIVSNGIEWSKCVGVSTDGARAMTTSVHCSLHREALAAKRIVNFIKARSLQSRLFRVLCEEMGSSHVQLLLHTEVRWLSRSKVLELSDRFTDFEWLAKLCYLSDIFTHLNGLNLSIQGKSVTAFHVQNKKIEATIKKLDMWTKHVEQSNSFDDLSDFLTKENASLPNAVSRLIVEHLQSLKMQLRDYFPALDVHFSWIENPFVDICQGAIASLGASEQDSLIDLYCDKYPDLSDKAVRFLMPFPTTYLCESGFSMLVVLKTKYRNRLNVEPDLHLQLSALQPDIHHLVAGKQHQPSH
uniref:DUF4371 domain-containing protein n=1 Tax=Pygocentrus nattereri TaxID=42514 RepID=A0AAR2IY92_PYGNA